MARKMTDMFFINVSQQLRRLDRKKALAKTPEEFRVFLDQVSNTTE